MIKRNIYFLYTIIVCLLFVGFLSLPVHASEVTSQVNTSSNTFDTNSLDSQTTNEEISEEDNNNFGENENITEEEYTNNVAYLTQVNTNDVKSILNQKDNSENLLYIGRPTCYYCRQFSPTLKDFNELTNNKLLYYDIHTVDSPEHDFAFNIIGIPGTPTTLRIKNGKVISAWIGGEKSSQELYNFLFSDQANFYADQSNIKSTSLEHDQTSVKEKLQEQSIARLPQTTEINEQVPSTTLLSKDSKFVANDVNTNTSNHSALEKNTTDKNYLPQTGNFADRGYESIGLFLFFICCILLLGFKGELKNQDNYKKYRNICALFSIVLGANAFLHKNTIGAYLILFVFIFGFFYYQIRLKIMH